MKIATISLALALGLLSCQQQQATAPTEKLALVGPGTNPDLTITAISAPPTAARNTAISVIHTTQNIGTAPAMSTQTRFWICTNTTVYGNYINTQVVGILNTGASVTLSNNNFIIPPGQPLGTNYIIAVCGYYINEITKANNTNTCLLIVTP